MLNTDFDSGCGHGKFKANCHICSDCGHGNVKGVCQECKDLIHQRVQPIISHGAVLKRGPATKRAKVGMDVPSVVRVGMDVPSVVRVGMDVPSVVRVGMDVPSVVRVGMDVPSVVQAVMGVPVNCEHCGNKSLCRLCSGCKHGKLIEDCSNVECSGCEHGFRNYCVHCRLCKHDIIKSKCDVCGKAGFCQHGVKTYRMAQPCIDCDRNALDHTARKQANKEVDWFLSHQRVLPILSYGAVLERGPVAKRADAASPFCLSNDWIALPTPPILSYETILGGGPVAKRADAASPFGLSGDLIAIFTPSVPDSQPKESAEPEEEWSPDEDFEPSLVTCSICRKTVDAMSARYSRLGGGSFVCSDC